MVSFTPIFRILGLLRTAFGAAMEFFSILTIRA